MSSPHDSRTGAEIDRRAFLHGCGGLATAALATPGLATSGESAVALPAGKAEHCIVLWLGGGASQIDTFDPKHRGDAKMRTPGSDYDAIPTAIAGEKVCEHLRRTAPLLDRAVLVRSVHHDVVDEHAAAVNRMHTGRPTSGTIVYPSMGSIVAHEKPPVDQTVPPYVIMGYPNLTRGPGFLGARHGFIYLTDTRTGPAGLAPPPGVDASRLRRREKLLSTLRDRYRERNPDETSIIDYAAVSERAFRLAGPRFMSAFRVDREPAALRESYGSEFGQRCLLARRLVERGVRFIEIAHNLNFVNGTGWDTHNEGQLNQHLLIRELDAAFSTLLRDLDEKKLLDRTLIIISTEFGRPPGFDARGGRGPQSGAVSVVLAGGGLRGGQVVGETDELARTVVRDPVSVPDLFASVFHALGIDPLEELYSGNRPVTITDRGRPIRRLFA